jgi:hypothetical protein
VESSPTDKPAAPEIDDDLPPPTGTMFVMMVYLVLLCALWGATYGLLVARQ